MQASTTAEQHTQENGSAINVVNARSSKARVSYPPEATGMIFDEKYGDLDNDVKMFFRFFSETRQAKILEVGANQEFASHILKDNGYDITGVDLLEFWGNPKPNYLRHQGDFCSLVKDGTLKKESYDAIFSTSALEHFGLGTYAGCPNFPDHDISAAYCIHSLLKPGGHFYLTVPYGKAFLVESPHWRVYNREHLQERLIRGMEVVEKVFFKSADCYPPDNGEHLPIVEEWHADKYSGSPPHLTVFLKLRKPVRR